MKLTSENEQPLLSEQQIRMLHDLKHLLDNATDIDTNDDREMLQNAVKNILKRKSEMGTIITGIRHGLLRIAKSFCKANNYAAAKSAITLLKTTL